MFVGLLISFVPMVGLYFLYKQKHLKHLEGFTENMNFKYYIPIQYLRKLFYSIFICTFNFSPKTQVITLIIWNSFMVAIILKFKPNKLKIYNIRDFISSTSFFVSTILLILFLEPKFSS